MRKSRFKLGVSVASITAIAAGLLMPIAASAAAIPSSGLQASGATYVIANSSTAQTLIGEIGYTDKDPLTKPLFSLVQGQGLAINSDTGAISTSETWTPSSHTGTILSIAAVTDEGITSVTEFRVEVLDLDSLAVRGLTVERWDNIPGTSVEDMTNSSRYRGQPDSVTTSPQPVFLETTTDNFGLRWTGVLIAPETGNYNFYLSSDDASEFRIGTGANSTSLSTSTQAKVTGWWAPFTWNPNSISADIKLVRGQIYYLQILYKEGGGKAHVSLGWKTPSGKTPVTPANANTTLLVPDFIIPSASLLPASTLNNRQPPSVPGSLSVETVLNSNVGLAWRSSKDADGIARYQVSVDGATPVEVIPTVGNSVERINISVPRGQHTFTVAAVDNLGNISDSATVRFDVKDDFDAISAALISGDSAGLTDAGALVSRARELISEQVAKSKALYSEIYSGVESFEFSPLDSEWLPRPSPKGAATTQTLLAPSSCSKGSCPKNPGLGTFGYAPKGSRFALTSAGALVAPSFSGPSENIVSWLVSGSGQSTPTVETKITVLEVSPGPVTAANLESTITGMGWSNSANMTVCNSVVEFANCSTGSDLVILQTYGLTDASSPDFLALLQALDQRGTPILWSENTRNYSISKARLDGAAYLGTEYANYNYYFLAKAQYSAAELLTSTNLLAANEYRDLDLVLSHLEKEDWDVDLSICTDYTCPTTSSAGIAANAYLASEFYAGAKDYLRVQLQALDSKNIDIFKTSQTLNQPLKLAVLLGDVYRRDLRYPLSPASSTTNKAEFFRAFFADHAVYNSRAHNPQQTDLGSFSRTLSPTLAHFNDKIDRVTRTGDYFTAAGVYIFPGETFTVTRTDHSAAQVQVFVNSLRPTSTHQMTNYARPKYLQSAKTYIAPDQTISLTNPYGGPLQIWLQGTTDPQSISLEIKNVGHHPVWNGDNTTEAFTAAMAAAEYDWAEFQTGGFEIHSRRSYLEKTLEDSRWNTPSKLAFHTNVNFYQANYNLAGFTGTDLALSESLAKLCETKSWQCTGRDPHGMTSMNHFNSDQAQCGSGCSGNPYDAWWYFVPLGWGDSHEMGHNIQRLQLVDEKGGIITNEVSNNVYPAFVKLNWNKKYPSLLTGDQAKPIIQNSLYDIVNSAQNTSNPQAAVASYLWNSGETPYPYEGKNLDLGMNRLGIYLQLVQQSANRTDMEFGQLGWDFVTMMYILERLIRKHAASNSDTLWNAQKDSLCMSNYSRDEAKVLYNGLGYNDAFLIMASCVAKLDQRELLSAWGIRFSEKAANQVAALGYPVAEKVFWVFPEDKKNTTLWSLKATRSVPIDGVSRTLPHLVHNVAYAEDDATTGAYGVHQNIGAFVGGTGRVSFLADGQPVPGCQNLTTADASVNWGGEDGTVFTNSAICDWVPTKPGNVKIQTIYDDGNPDGSANVSAPWVITVAPSDTPIIDSVSRQSVLEGSTVELAGSKFDDVTSVTFNGYDVPFTKTANQLVLTMPNVTADKVDGKFVINTSQFTIYAPTNVVVFKPVSSVELPANMYLNPGMRKTVKAEIAPTYATNQSLIWASSNTTVATVDSSGVVRAKNVGTTSITATSVDGSKSDSMELQVLASALVPAAFIDFDATQVSVPETGTVKLTAQVAPTNATDQNIQWSSADNSIATVSSSGVISGVRRGVTTVTASNPSSGVSESISVSVLLPVFADDVNNQVTGITNAMSFSLNSGRDWTQYNGSNLPNSTLAGNRAVLVKSSSGTAHLTKLLFTDMNTAANPMATVLPGAIYLSDLTATSQSNGYGAIRWDQSNSGNNITLGPVTYAKGLGLHANSTFTYSIPANASRFIAMVGVDEEVGGFGSVVFEVLVDGVSKKKTNTLTGPSAAELVDVDVSGGSVLTLKLTDGNGSISSDHADWAGAQFVPEITKIEITNRSQVLPVGQSLQLSAIITADTLSARAISWSSRNPEVALVNSEGMVTSLKPGMAEIVATSEIDPAVQVVARVSVPAPRVTSLSVGSDSIEIDLGDSLGLEINTTSEAGADDSIIWTSSDSSVATVSELGVLTAVSAGTALITAQAQGGFEVEILATVLSTKRVQGVSLSPDLLTTAVSTTAQLVATLSPVDASNQNLIWSSSNETVATVSDTGLVTAVGSGSATITVKTVDGNFVDSSTINVFVAVSDVTLNKTSATITTGTKLTLLATVNPSAATNKSVNWSSSNSLVASVSASGLVTALKAGLVTITATTVSGAKTASVLVEVLNPKEFISTTGVTLSQSSANLSVTGTLQLRASVTPSNSSEKSVTWASSKSSVATVSSTGLVTAVGPGTATISVTTVNGKKTKSAVIKVTIPVAGISLSQASATLQSGASLTLKATLLPLNASDRRVLWTSSNTKVATVDSSGKVRAKYAGTATITAKTVDGNLVASSSISVFVAVTGVIISKSNVIIAPQATLQLYAKALPYSATNRALIWTSSDESVATVSATGEVTALSSGSTTITATTVEGGKNNSVTVRVK